MKNRFKGFDLPNAFFMILFTYYFCTSTERDYTKVMIMNLNSILLSQPALIYIDGLQ